MSTLHMIAQAAIHCPDPSQALGEQGIGALYIQLFSLGILWVSIHCSGMCGPIMAGLIQYEIPSNMGGHDLSHKLKGVFLYQLGRALTYGTIGAMLGWVGLAIDAQARQFSRIAGLITAVVLLAVALHPIYQHIATKLRKNRAVTKAPSSTLSSSYMTHVIRRLQKRLPQKGVKRMFFYGVVLGLMPCMLMFWVMQLAIASAHPFHGAMLMLGLVFLTTPILAAAASFTQLKIFGGRAGNWLTSLSMLISATWIGLISAAANGWIDHVHTSMMIFGKPYMLMLF